MRIGMIAPPWFAVPPAGYGGIEWVVSNLAERLVERGHQVTLFASGGSRTAGRLVSSFDTPPSAELGDPYVESIALLDAYAHWQEFDVIHDHTMLGLIAGASLPIPVVHTVHGQVLPKFYHFYEHLAARVHLVAISHNQASTLPPECAPRVIHNGIDTGCFTFGEGRGGYLLFVGRMSPEKGIVQAIEIARQAGKRLVVIAKINEPPEREYFEREVRPLLQKPGLVVEFHEQTSHDEKVAAYQGALATLFPINWPEPFGLVMAESMACGTPVIAFRNGSVPEVIDDGHTGFICSTVEEAVAAAARVHELDRGACRERVLLHFSADRNAQQHEELYSEICAARLAPSLQPSPAVKPLQLAGG